MAAATAPLTVDQFLLLPEEEGVRQELVAGEVFTTPPGEQTHEIVKSNFTRELVVCMEHRQLAFVMCGTMYRLSLYDAPQPDVSVILSGRLDPGNTGLIALAPDIAVEVVSSESAKLLLTKVKLYLQHGTRAVWVAYPELRTVFVYEASGVRELSGEQPLEAPEVLSGFRVPVSAFFAGL
ncbi:MAG: Uma2 family endonuclease [Acidobacteria bacterium]|nr:Uma2 family endonuclease [Acidobacteriota bacterium]